MDFYMYHGRVRVGPPTTIEGDEVDDWGFEGPRLFNVVGFHCTYGAAGHFTVWFENKAARDAAFEWTGWEVWSDTALIAEFTSDGELLKAWNDRLKTWHYYGDWGMK